MIGDQIRRMRKERGLTLERLGNEAEITASYLSQIERELVEPSIATLRKIAAAFNVPVYKLLMEGDEEEKFIIRKNERKSSKSIQGKVVSEFFTPVAKEENHLNMVGLTAKIPPFSGSGIIDEAIHNAEEVILVVKGVLEITVEEDVYVLTDGDSIYIKSNLKHVIKNIGKDELELVSCISPAIY